MKAQNLIWLVTLSFGVLLATACGPQPGKNVSQGNNDSIADRIEQMGGSEGVGGGDPFVSDFRLLANKAFSVLEKTEIKDGKSYSESLTKVLKDAIVESTPDEISLEEKGAKVVKCAKWERDLNKITFNQMCWQSASLRGRVRLTIHETLGLQGLLDDSRYQVSSKWLEEIEKVMPEISRNSSTIKAFNEALLVASDKGDLLTMRELIEMGADPDYKNGLPFVNAISTGHPEVMDLLSASGAYRLDSAVKELIRSDRIISDDDMLAMSQKLYELQANLNLRLDDDYCKARLRDEDSQRWGLDRFRLCRSLIGKNVLERARDQKFPKATEFLSSIMNKSN